ncbi:MAG: RNA polymerase sigma factor [Chloroflexi bacterium]|nr:MAG: RNA polymerase sigma factor [Chloroflexota bacterium]
MLATDGDPMPDPPGAWGGLVSALQRHTVHGELAQLSKEDRQILSLAYLSGHTNREIAAMLRVSVSTVRRRLSAALARLEESMRRAGTWVSVLALLGLATYGRIAHSVRTMRWPSTVAMVAAGTATAVAVGVAVVGPGTLDLKPSLVPPTSRSMQLTGSVPSAIPALLVSITPNVIATATKHPNGPVASATKQATTELSTKKSLGCHGNPTSAPPAVPVGPREGHPTGPPVTHPGPGVCGASPAH